MKYSLLKLLSHRKRIQCAHVFIDFLINNLYLYRNKDCYNFYKRGISSIRWPNEEWYLSLSDFENNNENENFNYFGEIKVLLKCKSYIKK